jgi:hypothetical protein
MNSAIAKESSGNKKLGKHIAVTYASQGSCPKTCPLFQKGCYAETGPMFWSVTSKLNKSAIKNSFEIALEEAMQIDSLSGKNHLRIHVVGDCNTADSAEIIAKASERYMSKHKKIAWSYTHNHSILREKWGNVSILRSCHNVKQVEKAFRDGYASALIFKQFPSDKTFSLTKDIRVIPCPFQTGKAESCEKCKLCLQADKLHKNRLVIGFETHGVKKKQANLSAI